MGIVFLSFAPKIYGIGEKNGKMIALAYALTKVSRKIFDVVVNKVLSDKSSNVIAKMYTVIIDTLEYIADEIYKKDTDRILDTAEKICSS